MENHFSKLKLDHGVYINTQGVIIIVYVDDLLIFAKDEKVFHWLKNIFCNKFSMIDLGEMEFILGFQVIRDKIQINIMLG
jgi:hypothetical protein